MVIKSDYLYTWNRHIRFNQLCLGNKVADKYPEDHDLWILMEMSCFKIVESVLWI